MTFRALMLGAAVPVLAWSALSPAVAQTSPGTPATSTEDVNQAEEAAPGKAKSSSPPAAATKTCRPLRSRRPVLSGTDLAEQGRRQCRRAAVRDAQRRGQQFRPGHRFQRPRHRQGRAQHADHDRRDHLSRRRADLPRLFPGRALLRRRQHPGAARPAGHDRRPERDRRRGVRQHQRPDHRWRRSRLCQRQRRQLSTNSARRARSTCRSATPSPCASRSMACAATASSTSPARAARAYTGNNGDQRHHRRAPQPAVEAEPTADDPVEDRSRSISTSAPIRRRRSSNYYRTSRSASTHAQPDLSRPVRHRS